MNFQIATNIRQRYFGQNGNESVVKALRKEGESPAYMGMTAAGRNGGHYHLLSSDSKLKYDVEAAMKRQDIHSSDPPVKAAGEAEVRRIRRKDKVQRG